MGGLCPGVLCPEVLFNGVSVQGGLCPGGSLSGRPPLYGKERAVCILLECFLVFHLHAVLVDFFVKYRSETVNSNTVNSKFHLIRSYCEIFFYNFPNIPCLKCTVNSNFHLIRSKTLPMNDFELTVPDL